MSTPHFPNRTVLLGITGSIAAYKAAELTSQLVKASIDVRVIMTRNATKFVSPLTLRTLSRNPVCTNLFEEEETDWNPGHIDLADRADLLVIAPASANILAKLANGLADDPLSTIALACRAPLLLAPAMNGKMWEHPATLRNTEILRERNAQFIGPETGLLACGYEGIGKLWEVGGIAEKIFVMLAEASK